MKHNTTHTARLQARQAVSKGYATPLVTVQSRAMLASIHGEIAPVLKAMRQADIMLNNVGAKGRPVGTTKGVEMEPRAIDKYNVEFRMASGRDVPGSLAGENDAFAGLYFSKSEQAREHTQTTAGGLHAGE